MTVLPAGIEVGIIPKLKEGERRIVYVDVGNLSAHKAMEYLERVQFALKDNEEFNDQYCIFSPVREGVRSLTFSVEQSMYDLRGKTLSDEEFAALEAAYLVHKATRSDIQ